MLVGSNCTGGSNGGSAWRDAEDIARRLIDFGDCGGTARPLDGLGHDSLNRDRGVEFACCADRETELLCFLERDLSYPLNPYFTRPFLTRIELAGGGNRRAPRSKGSDLAGEEINLCDGREVARPSNPLIDITDGIDSKSRSDRFPHLHQFHLGGECNLTDTGDSNLTHHALNVCVKAASDLNLGDTSREGGQLAGVDINRDDLRVTAYPLEGLAHISKGEDVGNQRVGIAFGEGKGLGLYLNIGDTRHGDFTGGSDMTISLTSHRNRSDTWSTPNDVTRTIAWVINLRYLGVAT